LEGITRSKKQETSMCDHLRYWNWVHSSWTWMCTNNLAKASTHGL